MVALHFSRWELSFRSCLFTERDESAAFKFPLKAFKNKVFRLSIDARTLDFCETIRTDCQISVTLTS